MKGECSCGAFAFDIVGTIDNLYQCHCSICRKTTGAASNAAFIVSRDRFTWQRVGKCTSFRRPSGYLNQFCTKCGSSLPFITSDELRVWVPAGLVQAPHGTRIARHIYVGSKASWDDICSDAECHEGMPEDWP